MVAFAKDYLPAESPARSQNRAECFFVRALGRAGHGAPAARFHAGENSRCRYDVCQGASLAQEEQLTVGNAIDPETDAAIQDYLKNGEHLALLAPRRVLSPIEAAAGGGGYGGASPRGRIAPRGAMVGNYKLSGTVSRHLTDRIGGAGPYQGQLSRPYLNSPNTIRDIISTGKGIPDPGGLKGGIRYDVPGTFRGSQGTWELVIQPSTNTIYHFNFVTPPGG